ncbi:MAG: oligosaccharide flippase family protein [Deltaproteobacteria bacterium]|nr:oligosaccharide flippase family protein [Deltaproteobacteria bacterium]
MTSPPSIRRNIIANFAGKGWTAIISIVFVPLYIKFLGIESYGLIGVYISLIGLLSILDLGLSSTVSRELARLSAVPGNEQESRELVRTMEIIYWGIGILIAIGILACAPKIAQKWLNTKGISVGTVEKALEVMGIVVAFEWPAAFYTGGLMGLQRQVLFNVVRTGMATVQAVGAVLVLWLISPTIEAYFKWQILVSVSQTCLLGACLWSSLPETGVKSSFNKSLLEKHWKFAAGMTGISVVATILTQLDKIVLSKLLSLEMFGYYILAFNVANALNLLVHPVFAALFPKFSQLVAEGKELELSALYHRGCQFLSVVVFPVAITAIFYSREILLLWINDPGTVRNTHLLMSLLLTGTLLNSIMILPYTLQLSYGWTKLSFYKNLIAVIILVPLLIVLVTTYGSVGAAIIWILLNAGYFLIEIPFMHSRIFKDQMWQWYLSDVGSPLIAVFVIVLFSRLLFPSNASLSSSTLWVFSTFTLSLLFSFLLFSHTREWLKQEFSRYLTVI